MLLLVQAAPDHQAVAIPFSEQTLLLLPGGPVVRTTVLPAELAVLLPTQLALSVMREETEQTAALHTPEEEEEERAVPEPVDMQAIKHPEQEQT